MSRSALAFAVTAIVAAALAGCVPHPPEPPQESEAAALCLRNVDDLLSEFPDPVVTETRVSHADDTVSVRGVYLDGDFDCTFSRDPLQIIEARASLPDGTTAYMIV